MKSRYPWLPSYPLRNHVVNSHGTERPCQTVELSVHFPLIEKSAERHEPDFPLRTVQQAHAVKQQPGERFFFAYPAVCAFFSPVSSLWTYRLVPLYSAATIAFLYSERSYGVESSSTASSVKSCRLSSGCQRLWIITD